uniref:Uncharacterized protein n=1 Tax=Tanacetum cinerariifolium TaxID=118510 RepID=A0A699KAZ2_TANCI|nr:hypothetical protein [Tanacetum cinerariifolium]
MKHTYNRPSSLSAVVGQAPATVAAVVSVDFSGEPRNAPLLPIYMIPHTTRHHAPPPPPKPSPQPTHHPTTFTNRRPYLITISAITATTLTLPPSSPSSHNHYHHLLPATTMGRVGANKRP